MDKNNISLLSALFYDGTTASNETITKNNLVFRCWFPTSKNTSGTQYYTDISFPQAFNDTTYRTLYLTATHNAGAINKIPYFIQVPISSGSTEVNHLLSTDSNHTINKT